MRPKRNSDEQRSLTQKTNCCLIYFQICRTKRQRSSSKAAHTISTSAAFFMVLLAEKRVRTQVLTVKKAKEVPGICFVLLLLLPRVLKFFYIPACYVLQQQQFIYKYASRDDAIFSFQTH